MNEYININTTGGVMDFNNINLGKVDIEKNDFEARKIVEALRSGVSSRSVGQYFSSARPEIMKLVADKLSYIRENKTSDSLIVAGKYGEGKTHLLNSVFNLAHSDNMAVSFLSLSKETPFNHPYLVYKKLLQNTYLPMRLQPGFLDLLHEIAPNHPLAAEMQAYTAKNLETDKLFYLFRAYLNTDSQDEKYSLLADLEGEFIYGGVLKKIYKRIFNEKIYYNTNFSKTKHMDDYFATLSHLFLTLGYNGWVILFDETELIGRLGKKARLKAYKDMATFLFPGGFSRLQAVCSIFAITSSYIEDVIEGKREFDNLRESGYEGVDYDAVEKTLQAICEAKRLHPLTKEEIAEVMAKLKDFYIKAYKWEDGAGVDMGAIAKKTEGREYLLRTRIRAAVECLDQLYQYNQTGEIRIDELKKVSYEEDIDETMLDD